MINQICQSCGMPMEKTEMFGSNDDGSQSVEYCVYCFKDGKFTDEGITMEQKIAKNIEIAKKMGMTEDKAKEMANQGEERLKKIDEELNKKQ